MSEVMSSLANKDSLPLDGLVGGLPQDPIEIEKTEKSITWVIKSHGKVAERLTADFKPTEDGAKTKISVHTEAGDANADLENSPLRLQPFAKSVLKIGIDKALIDKNLWGPTLEECTKVGEEGSCP
jgi:hypothetical protein